MPLPLTRASTHTPTRNTPCVLVGDMNVLERILMKNIYQKSQGVNQEKTLKAAFKQFDTDGSGEVEFKEFTLASACTANARPFTRVEPA